MGMQKQGKSCFATGSGYLGSTSLRRIDRLLGGGAARVFERLSKRPALLLGALALLLAHAQTCLQRRQGFVLLRNALCVFTPR